jgi:hypothetical protein
LSVQSLAQAGVVGAEAFISVTDRHASLDRVNAVLARTEVRRELERLGVDPLQTEARVAALSDQELQSLATDLEGLPAGGSLLATAGIVFVVLLILELVGVIDIFKKI